MHGLINRAIQCFLRDTYGPAVWEAVAQAADVRASGFEALLVYDDDITLRLLDQAHKQLSKSHDEVLEDLGTYLASHENVEALRRLLRFSGATFHDFLMSLNELPDRARLAVPDLDLPPMSLTDLDAGRFALTCGEDLPGFSHVLLGILRAMADDYGALVFLDHKGPMRDGAVIDITLLDEAFAEGRSFALARAAE